jgi:two-component system CheB/CheR fusion protein
MAKKSSRQRAASPRRRKSRVPAPPAALARPTAGPEPDAPAAQYLIVGIGASAGGIEAVKKLLHHLTADAGPAYVLVQHLSPQHDSFLAELLDTASEVPVVQATEHMRLVPNRLHVIPPNVQMTLIAGHLHLAPRPQDASRYNPIDAFFESLAMHARERGVAIVLSGSASDGAAGLREVKSAGGLTMAQDPKTAKYDSMPRAAIETGVVDLVLSPEAMGRELVRLGAHPFLRPVANALGRLPDLPMSEPQLERLFFLLKKSSGVDFSYYKVATVKRRVQRRMTLHKLTEVQPYLRMLASDVVELRNLYRDLLIHVTRFFREPESFEVLKTLVFPRVLKSAANNRRVRIWVPGCATGEEAYSVAIVLLEYLGEDVTSTPIQVFATDVSEEAIDAARLGTYGENIASDVSPERLRRFFVHSPGQYRISKVVRDSCVFARQDLTRDPPFSKLDLIVCRNVLIYLGQRLQRRLMSVFHYALKPSGFLMLGSSESVGPDALLFAVADKRHQIYSRRNTPKPLEIGLATARPAIEPTSKRAPFAAAGAIARPPDLQTEVTRLLLGRYSPAGVLVNNDLQIVQTRGRTGAFLELSAGDANLDVLKMAREGLLHGLRSALLEVKRTGKPARRERLVVKREGGTIETNVQVFPFTDSSQATFFLVLFESQRPGKARAEQHSPRKRPDKMKDDLQIKYLEQELSSSREYLQSIIQDLEAANEELQSANEEILSSNEELQSTNEELDTAKEELQSTNEELNTVNDELNTRNDELNRLNSDLMNLLGAVPAAVVIVSSDLRVRRFTPLAEQILNLIPSDVGRRLGDIKPNLDVPDLQELTREVIQTMQAKELDAHDRSGRRFTLRIRPYKNQENRIDGAVLTFVDIARH